VNEIPSSSCFRCADNQGPRRTPTHASASPPPYAGLCRCRQQVWPAARAKVRAHGPCNKRSILRCLRLSLGVWPKTDYSGSVSELATWMRTLDPKGDFMRRMLGLLALVVGLLLPPFNVQACVEEIEWNDSAETADYIGSVPGSVCGVGRIGEPGDLDVWAFEITQPSLIRIETSANMYDGDTIIALYDADLRLIYSDDDSGEGYFSLIDLEAAGELLDPGDYYVAVGDVSASFSSDRPYQVTVTGFVPEETPESAPPESWGCDMSRYVRFKFTSHMHLVNNRGNEGWYGPSVLTKWDHPLQWSGNSFSVAYTTTHTVDNVGYMTETITRISVSGRVSSDCRTMLSVTASKTVEEVVDGELEWIETFEISLVNLPLDQSGVLVPRCDLEGQEITEHVAHFKYGTDFAKSDSDDHWVESFALRSQDGMRVELSVPVD